MKFRLATTRIRILYAWSGLGIPMQRIHQSNLSAKKEKIISISDKIPYNQELKQVYQADQNATGIPV